MATNSQTPLATDSAADLHALVGDDATASFENDPTFIQSTPTASASSENLTAATADIDDPDDADADDDDLDEEDEEDEEDELDDTDDDVEDGELDDDEAEAATSPALKI